MDKGLTGIALILLALALLPQVGASCVVMTPHGPEQDTDCDGIIDPLDNCPAVRNTDQRDLDRNRIGDACDSLIEEILIEPDNRVEQGGFAHVVVRVINNAQRPLQDLRVSVRNTELRIDDSETVPLLPRGEAAYVDFWVKVPACAKAKTYTLSVSARDRAATAQARTERLTVTESGACGASTGPLDTTIVNVFNEATLGRGESLLTPITITNRGDGQATYHVAVKDIDFGTWRVDPASSITLPAGHDGTLYLYLKADDDAEAGHRTVQLTITSGRQTTTVPIDVYVRVPVLPEHPPQPPLFWIGLIIAVFVLLVIAATGIALWRFRKGREPGREQGAKRTTKGSKSTRRRKVAVEDVDEPRFETRY